MKSARVTGTHSSSDVVIESIGRWQQTPDNRTSRTFERDGALGVTAGQFPPTSLVAFPRDSPDALAVCDQDFDKHSCVSSKLRHIMLTSSPRQFTCPTEARL